ncbi:MAG: hypothetical protein ACR2QH_15135 [Geminicoccaceae bacterium]
MNLARYNKFWMSLTGPLAAGLITFFGLDASTAESITAAVISLVGPFMVAAGPANK